MCPRTNKVSNLRDLSFHCSQVVFNFQHEKRSIKEKFKSEEKRRKAQKRKQEEVERASFINKTTNR